MYDYWLEGRAFSAMTTEDSGLQEAAAARNIPGAKTEPVYVWGVDGQPHRVWDEQPAENITSPSPAAVTGEWTYRKAKDIPAVRGYDLFGYEIVGIDPGIPAIWFEFESTARVICECHNLALAQLTARAEKAKEEIESWRFFHRKAVERAEAAELQERKPVKGTSYYRGEVRHRKEVDELRKKLEAAEAKLKALKERI